MNIKALKTDVPAGLVVFLVALPLCLGIALASGAPLMSGIISGIIGGIIIGFMSGSQTSVSGPAAGLAAVVLASIQQLGSFEVFLFAVILAGLMQLALGFAKMGYIADFFPSNVIKGLLAAIGIVLILKQIPYSIGYDADLDGGFSIINLTGENTFAGLFHVIEHITPGAIIISIVSLIILLYWQKIPLKNITFLPPSLVVVVIGIGLSGLFHNLAPAFIIGHKHMVNVPAIDFSSLESFVHIPDFSLFARSDIWIVAVTLAVVASLETLLNLEAVDKIDPHKRHSPPNRELIAQGIGNVLAGLFGGIPVTSVIVRSSVNIQTGNETKFSAIFHGVLLLLSVLFLAPLINMIPLASLATILLVTGYKLANVPLFRSMYAKGTEQFIPFIATVLAIVFTDLLIGVLVGLAISIAFLLISNVRNPYLKQHYTLHVGEVMRLELPNQVTFLNKASIKGILRDIPEDRHVIIDAISSDFIDPDIIEIIEEFKDSIALKKRIRVDILGQRSTYQLKDRVQFMNVLGREERDSLSSKDILDLLKKGNKRFVEGEISKKDFSKQVEITSKQHNPLCVIIGCVDPRTTPEILFDTGLGDILTIRIAGNSITQEIIDSLEIACSTLDAKLIIVKAYTLCGAVTLAMNDFNEHSTGSIPSKIKHIAEEMNVLPLKHDGKDEEVIEKVSRQNAIEGVQEILTLSPFLADKISKGELGIVSAYHDIRTGVVMFDPMLIGSQTDLSSK